MLRKRRVLAWVLLALIPLAALAGLSKRVPEFRLTKLDPFVAEGENSFNYLQTSFWNVSLDRTFYVSPATPDSLIRTTFEHDYPASEGWKWLSATKRSGPLGELVYQVSPGFPMKGMIRIAEHRKLTSLEIAQAHVRYFPDTELNFGQFDFPLSNPDLLKPYGKENPRHEIEKSVNRFSRF